MNGGVREALERPWFHLIEGGPPSVFVVPGSMLFDVEENFFDALRRDDPHALDELRALSVFAPEPRDASRLEPVTALSLNVAQACNLACAYCYADEGRFGGSARLMSASVARSGIDRLIRDAKGRDVTVGFIGGEPFLNRGVIHDAVAHARAAAGHAGIRVRFSVTTNATLLTGEDIALLSEHGFTVTVSLDGDRDRNTNRLTHGGADSSEATLRGIQPLLTNPGSARIAVRCTITRQDLDVAARVRSLGALGFTEIGVSPARTSPRDDLILREEDWPVFLDNMIEAAEDEFDQLSSGGKPRFSNLWNALRAIHRGSARSLPCGSVDSYLSLDADGGFHSCHRTVQTPGFEMGSIKTGVDTVARRAFLARVEVDLQKPCASCWARYLCGGGCHAEVAVSGRSGCDFIRGWLDYCIRKYREAAGAYPGQFAGEVS